MLKKFLFTFLFSLSTFATLPANDLTKIPEQFFVKQHWLSLTNTFDIESVDRKYGTVHRKLLSWTPNYLFYDIHDQLQARAKMRFFTFGATFDIYDANEQSLGTVEERIFTFFPLFDLYRADGYHTAKAKLNFWGTKYTVKDPETDEVIAYLSRKFFRLKDDWKVDIVNPTLFAEKQIDPRCFILVMAFQTDRDYWSRHRDTVSNSSPSSKLASTPKNLEPQHTLLETYRDQFYGIEPTDADIQSVELMVDNYLDKTSPSPHDHSEPSHAERIEQGINTLLPLFDSPNLSIGQKSALFLMMDQLLN